ncbi:hypothetical protein BWQ96_09780 [Gracilariopsis chorda]|uniref:Uncharacterized protein n=1 Tax=Gracilariopsis chorda TaxID=448386 RepID=A0A2V3IEI6_9FLOR|nr:hypothetical protein BWQ96_09780 [Gracilariopsis chorda]|eukprot:PXF40499.1 hypothetical protein BWQ96_09780 [Gracilariopsis chorda]
MSEMVPERLLLYILLSLLAAICVADWRTDAASLTGEDLGLMQTEISAHFSAIGDSKQDKKSIGAIPNAECSAGSGGAIGFKRQFSSVLSSIFSRKGSVIDECAVDDPEGPMLWSMDSTTLDNSCVASMGAVDVSMNPKDPLSSVPRCSK